ncbi:hypothetical protein CLAIMM_06667 [Cladophialophora immunda]|nr:hypothetical protein CLAIMM_06667 [Cladophialophora immunda]
MGDYSSINICQQPAELGDLLSRFNLQAAPGTDIYATPVPPIRHVFSAPIVYRRMPKQSFQFAGVTVRCRWAFQFDQGGLVFVIPRTANPEPDARNAQNPTQHPEWVKVGFEVNDGAAYVSVVAKSHENWCDWSLVPLSSVPASSEEVEVSLQLTREKNALMVWWVPRREDKVLIRKVPWVFLETEDAQDSEAWVGVYCARPDPDNEARKGQASLVVAFEGLDVRG